MIALGLRARARLNIELLRNRRRDPATGLPIGNTEKNLKAAVHGETYEYETMYPGMAKQAREEGYDDVAEWFETLAKAEKSHAGRFTKALGTLKE